jgi:hypothetical protein
MKEFRRDPYGSLSPASDVMSDLVYGWGNEDWSASVEYLTGCLKEVLLCDGSILECGSGLTTVTVGVIAERAGSTVYSLENDEPWLDRVSRYLAKYQITSVHLLLSPLKDYGSFSWYAPPLGSMPDRFSLVICDGPPGDTRGGRYGLLPIMKERLAPGCIIMLDDARRREEQAIAARWAEELDATIELRGSKDPYFRIGDLKSEEPDSTSLDTLSLGAG